jgi:adenine/guanine phosphoribosyltransferase-like PRPP-binding protein
MIAKLQVALRDSATATRPYVVVNPLLAKHLPSTPSISLEYFRQLGTRVAKTCEGERVLVIGFAETATAVGAAVASMLDNAVFCHTTREAMPSDLLISDFSEEHSHATAQALYLNSEFRDLELYDRIVFVEDEITTGKTILNFLRTIDYKGKFTVSALVFNGFDTSVFDNFDVEFCCVQSTNTINYLTAPISNPRIGTTSYQADCELLAAAIVECLNSEDVIDKSVLVLGTEEFMYPALVLGVELEKSAARVVSQSTTRSPLLAQNQNGYPLNSRADFPSPYDENRTTYLYNLNCYDTVIVLTDAGRLNPNSNAESLLNSIREYGNGKIYFVRVGE